LEKSIPQRFLDHLKIRRKIELEGIGLTWRSAFLGLGLVVLISFGAPHSVWIIHSSEITWSYFPSGAGVSFVFLIFVNALLKRLRAFRPLNPAELVTILVMGLVASGMPTFIAGYLLAIISEPYYGASDENEWATYILPYLPEWAVPKPDNQAVDFFYEGLPLGQEQIPFDVWVGPLFWWLMLIMTVFFVCFCMVVILRRQWVENERLAFPLVQVPLMLVEETPGSVLPPIVRERTFWIGVGVPLSIILFNIINYFEPAAPTIPIQSGVMGLELVKGVFPLTVIIYFPVVGFVYLVSSSISFSVLFFYLFTLLESSVVQVAGYHLTRADPFSWGWQLGLAWQAYGAFMAMVGWSIWMGRHHLRAVLRQVFSGSDGIDDEREMMSYRVAVYGFIAGAVFILAWLYRSGMDLIVAVLCLFAALTIFLGITRLVIQTGLHHLTSPVSAQGFARAITGTAIEPHNLVALSLSYSWCGDIQSIFMTATAHAAKLNERCQRHRRLAVAIFVAAGLSFVASTYFMLELFYDYGAINARWRAGEMAYKTLVNMTTDPWPVMDAGKLAYFALGALLYSLVFVFHYRFFWWPLHPVGLTVATLWMTRHIVISVLISWALKRLILRYGGVALYRRLLPFFIGLPVGYFIGVGISYAVDVIWFYGKGHRIMHGG
jgi:hypothetical protein